MHLNTTPQPAPAHTHGDLATATAAALVQAGRTRAQAAAFLAIAPSAQQALAPVLDELDNFGQQLQRMRADDDVPDPIRPLLAELVRGCHGVCARIRDILRGCGDDAAPETGWAVVGASAEIEQLRVLVGHGRRTCHVVNEALLP